VGETLEINCSDKTIPCGKENLVYKAAELIKKKRNIKKGLKIFIDKKIPASAGLGGGSANAGATLNALNDFWNLNLSLDKLIELAKLIGADVSYNLVGGIQLEFQGGQKAGKFRNLGKLPECFLVVCFPEIKINTKTAYSQVNYKEINKNNLSALIKAIKAKDLKKIGTSLHNDFEIWMIKKYPIVGQLKKLMIKYGAVGSLMTGKGSTVFGIFDDSVKADKAYRFLRKQFKQTFLGEPV